MRLIDADALDVAITVDYYEHFTRFHDSDQIALIDMVRDDIAESPTVDASPVVHARWEPMYSPYGELEGWICKCGFSSTSFSNYCPSCGAKMEDRKSE